MVPVLGRPHLRPNDRTIQR